MLNFDEIKELLELVASKGLSGLEIERSGFRLTIDGRPQVAAGTQPVEAAAPAPVPATEVTPRADEPSATVETSETVGHIVPSPIVGTFYSAPSPDADPYVRVGDRVTEGQVLCIVEAMKLMNEIESDVDGVVVEIYPQNAQPVEYGERLFAIQAG